jgi:hypothetical protein
MTQKEKCIQHCKDYLQSLQLLQSFNSEDFNHVYNKFNGSQANPYTFGLRAADHIISNSKNYSYDTGNAD